MVNKGLLNFPDFVKIGLIAVLALIFAKWGFKTIGMASVDNYL